MTPWFIVGLVALAALLLLAITGPEVASFLAYMGSCAKRWFD